MMNRIAQKLFLLSLFCLILVSTAYGADEQLAEAVKKDLREHNEFTTKNGADATKKRFETEGTTRFADWKKAAEEGLPEGQILLATCYCYGVNVPKDHKEAIKWIRKAAEVRSTSLNFPSPVPMVPIQFNFVFAPKPGNADAQYLLGMYYFEGIGVPTDAKKAIEWFRRAAEQEHAEAQFQFGKCYFNGWGIPEDKEEAIRWYHKAAEQGLVDAQLAIGGYYISDSEDKEEGFKWLSRAAEQGHVLAQTMLGVCYLEGKGVAKNATEGIKWLRNAAVLGESLAQYQLGKYYYEGVGVPQDMTEAIKWFRRAKAQGSEKFEGLEEEIADVLKQVEEEEAKTSRTGSHLFDTLSSPSLTLPR